MVQWTLEGKQSKNVSLSLSNLEECHRNRIRDGKKEETVTRNLTVVYVKLTLKITIKFLLNR